MGGGPQPALPTLAPLLTEWFARGATDEYVLQALAYSEPEDSRSQQTASYPWGTPVELPEPLGFTLDTEKLKDYAD
ncbi:hypothetical protein [Streptomyces sp. NPDC001714]|uniref:hypothetical protein n=1 Tax=Streptomyces sp. NPDC001714 TaxID=3364603 RepID=UPI0036C57822